MLYPFRSICLYFLPPVAPFDLAFISVCQPVKSRIKVKILHLLNNQAPSYHKTKWDYIRALRSQAACQLVVRTVFKSRKEANVC